MGPSDAIVALGENEFDTPVQDYEKVSAAKAFK